MNYDIFISYRHIDGLNIARNIQLKLENFGCSVFLDHESIRDGNVSEEILNALNESKVFLAILTPKYLEECSQKEDWVAREIRQAVKNDMHIVPLNIDRLFKEDYIPLDCPYDIVDAIIGQQIVDIFQGQQFSTTMQYLYDNSIHPYIRFKRSRWTKWVLLVLLIASVAIGGYKIREKRQQKKQTTITQDNNYTEIANDLYMNMIWVEGGEFQMGSDSTENECPIHTVTLDGYWIAETEVTQAQWETIMGKTLRQHNPNFTNVGLGPDYPMYYVSYMDAMEFCERLSNLTGKDYSLPTEAQWEFAARGGTLSENYTFSGSDCLDEVACYSDIETQPVKTQDKANELGLYDMSGNVWEWCKDWYSPYSDTALSNPAGPESGEYRSIRGGSWDSITNLCRTTYRGKAKPEIGLSYDGFRVVCNPDS